MGELVSYATAASSSGRAVATITMDDGKVNALSPAMFGELNAALDQAQAEQAVVVLAGRDGVFSAGFDLKTLRAGGADAIAMVSAGFELAHRMLAFPAPIVVACTGHAIAMGVFLLQSGDYRVAATGAYTISANEVAIGITMPFAAIEILRQRLTPAALSRAIGLAEQFSVEDALAGGFVDAIVPLAEVVPHASSLADRLAALDPGAHAASKLRARRSTLAALRAAIDEDAGAALL